jgi:hypothetical protein
MDRDTALRAFARLLDGEYEEIVLTAQRPRTGSAVPAPVPPTEGPSVLDPASPLSSEESAEEPTPEPTAYEFTLRAAGAPGGRIDGSVLRVAEEEGLSLASSDVHLT